MHFKLTKEVISLPRWPTTEEEKKIRKERPIPLPTLSSTLFLSQFSLHFHLPCLKYNMPSRSLNRNKNVFLEAGTHRPPAEKVHLNFGMEETLDSPPTPIFFFF